MLFYKVWANQAIHEIKQQEKKVEIDNAHITRMNYTLKELMAFTEYDIAVQACTKECSEPSRTKMKTMIGAPGNFSTQPEIAKLSNSLLTNYTSARISWKEPVFKGGELDYYEFKTKWTSGDGREVERIVKTRKMDCVIEQLCSGDVMFYDFSVRAVNFVLTPHSKETQVRIEGSHDQQNCEADDKVLIQSLETLRHVDPHGWHLPGPWSPPIGHSCHFGINDSRQNLIAIISIVTIVSMSGMVYYLYAKYKTMKDILVTLPPGLENLTGDKMKGKDPGCDLGGKPDILRNVDNTSINCEDENGQLLKKSLNGSLNGADCSSSVHSDSTRSEMDQIEDEIEYGEFGNDTRRENEDGLKVSLIEN